MYIETNTEKTLKETIERISKICYIEKQRERVRKMQLKFHKKLLKEKIWEK